MQLAAELGQQSEVRSPEPEGCESQFWRTPPEPDSHSHPPLQAQSANVNLNFGGPPQNQIHIHTRPQAILSQAVGKPSGSGLSLEQRAAVISASEVWSPDGCESQLQWTPADPDSLSHPPHSLSLVYFLQVPVDAPRPKSPATRLIELVHALVQHGPEHAWCDELLDGFKENAERIRNMHVTLPSLTTVESFYKNDLLDVMATCSEPVASEAVSAAVDGIISFWRQKLSVAMPDYNPDVAEFAGELYAPLPPPPAPSAVPEPPVEKDRSLHFTLRARCWSFEPCRSLEASDLIEVSSPWLWCQSSSSRSDRMGHW